MSPSASRVRCLRSLVGLSVGDAFGEAFFVGDDVRAAELTEQRELPDGPWRWTDDTAMALSVVGQLLHAGNIEPGALAAAFARRYVDDPVRGYGRGAHDVLAAIATGVPWPVAARTRFPDGSRGNGAAMRSAPIGAWFADDPARAIDAARASALPTHAHPDAVAGAIAVALAAGHAALAESSPAPGALLRHVHSAIAAGPVREGVKRAIELVGASPQEAARQLETGQRVLAEDTVPFALWCADGHLDAYEEALWTTVAGLGDRDTTCAIVGGIVGSSPRAQIPPDWLHRREPLPDLGGASA
jgi:ADP-ribosylglycohydrolase